MASYELLQKPSHCCYCCYRKSAGGEPTWLFACTHCRCFGCVTCWLLLGMLAAEIAVGFFAGREFVRRRYELEQNITECQLAPEQLKMGDYFCGPQSGGLLRTPENMTRSMWFPACTSTYLVEEMAEFNKQHEYKLVRFQSRAGDAGQPSVTLDAWWLPVSHTSPRVVIVHGNNENFNDWSVQLPGYFLRSMGFSVLIPNLRDHGSSGVSSGGAPPDRGAASTWGWAYHLDVLGAWDFVVRDPKGELGGPMDMKKVGLQGHAMGGFSVATATGIEHNVVGAWLDSPVFDPRHILRFHLERLLGVAAPLFLHASWFFANKLAKADLAHATPAKAAEARVASLSSGSFDCSAGYANWEHGWSGGKKAWCCRTTGRGCAPDEKAAKSLIFACAATTDRAVPASEAGLLVAELGGAGGEAFEVVEHHSSPAACGSSSHLALAVWKPDLYRQKLCQFWSRALRRDRGECGLARLPHFATDVAAVFGWAERPTGSFFG